MAISSATNISTEASSLPSSRRSNPLFTVVSWELRRLWAARSTWIIVLLVFVLSGLLELVFSSADQRTISSAFGPRTFWLDWGSNFGFLHFLPEVFGMGLALFTPFLCTDGIVRDLKRGTHELLMTTTLPSWAYVWGRYLSSLLLSLGLACLMLLAFIFVAPLKHQIQPDLYLAPDLRDIIVLWAIIVLPPAIILSSISFALGTIWPRLSALIKVVLIGAWFLMGPISPRLTGGQGLGVWDPTSQSAALQAVSTGDFLHRLALQTQHQNTQLFLATLHAQEQQLPDLSTWIVPHLLCILVALAFVPLAALLFRRFRNV